MNPAVPERVSKIVQKMMAKHPENRFQTAAELSRYLEPLAERSPVEFDFDAILAQRGEAAEERHGGGELRPRGLADEFDEQAERRQVAAGIDANDPPRRPSRGPGRRRRPDPPAPELSVTPSRFPRAGSREGHGTVETSRK